MEQPAPRLQVMKTNNINFRLKSKLVNKANSRTIAQNIDMRFVGHLAAKFGVVDSTMSQLKESKEINHPLFQPLGRAPDLELNLGVVDIEWDVGRIFGFEAILNVNYNTKMF